MVTEIKFPKIDSKTEAVLKAIAGGEAAKREAQRNVVIEAELYRIQPGSLNNSQYIAAIKTTADNLYKENKDAVDALHASYKKLDELRVAQKGGTPAADCKAGIEAENAKIEELFKVNHQLVATRAYLVLAKTLDPDSYKDIYLSIGDPVNGKLAKIKEAAANPNKPVQELHSICAKTFRELVQGYYAACEIELEKSGDKVFKVKRTGFATFEVMDNSIGRATGSRKFRAGDTISVKNVTDDPVNYLETRLVNGRGEFGLMPKSTTEE